VDLILLEGMRDLIVEILMQFLETCSDLVSNFQHNSFEGHFKFGVTIVAECNVEVVQGRFFTSS